MAIQIFFKELSLDEGFTVLGQPSEHRLVQGKLVSSPSGAELFKHLHSLNRTIRCFNCGCKADRWIADKGKTDKSNKPVLNLYGIRRKKLVMINRDHIIPRSLGGVDAVKNLRAACDICNTKRGNKITPKDLNFRLRHPELIDNARLEKGIRRAKDHITLLLQKPGNDGVISDIKKPFSALGIIL